ncbi:MAG TPA: sodium:calcium antiporter [Blastocatellia bacterium]|nr:sodium:calcium antiporter [Blastocatellia bacterium]HMV83411.1 sodium:calcium antiporter [Blastocatellia bacterium]HMY73232.1 sodium:calcium antiporter [Blastocatellia bacterium]HMZ20402.1 sodium:calcium antiporter [Blastocatellia bacterium]HNG28114.1 sodium:calcium antiporter [Blastocatellia bacterium]
MRKYLPLFLSTLIPLPWLFLAITGKAHSLSPTLVSLLSGLSIVGAAFLLGWGAELSERDIPRSLALIVLALISVLPEYAISLHYAWTEGIKHSNEGLAIANMTGANRILIGVGWAMVAIVYYFKHKKDHIVLDQSQGLELSLLLLATVYSLIIPIKGTLSLLDAAIFFAMFLYYAGRAMKGEKHDEELEGIAAELDAKLGNNARRLVVALMFGFAGIVIWFSAEPFAEGLKETGKAYNVNEFLLVQWLAPLASESPEGLIALVFALKGKGSTGIGALISSKVNQWTLLVGAIPLVYAIAAGIAAPMILDNRQKEELLLTSAQSLFAAIVIADFRFALWEAMMLMGLFFAQFFFPQESIRYIFSGLYLLATVALIASSKVRRQMLWNALLFRQGRPAQS